MTVGDKVAGIVRHRGYGNAKEANRLSFWEEERAENAFELPKNLTATGGVRRARNDDMPLKGGHHSQNAA